MVKGWHQESARHSLASHGIKTGRKGCRSRGIRQLSVTEIGGKDYYVDERLKQLRNVNDPHDIIPLEKYDNKEMREAVEDAFIYASNVSFYVMKNGEVGSATLQQHPNYRNALYPDVYTGTPDWIFNELDEDILGSANVHTDTDGVMKDIIIPIREKGYDIYVEI